MKISSLIFTLMISKFVKLNLYLYERVEVRERVREEKKVFLFNSIFIILNKSTHRKKRVLKMLIIRYAMA